MSDGFVKSNIHWLFQTFICTVTHLFGMLMALRTLLTLTFIFICKALRLMYSTMHTKMCFRKHTCSPVCQDLQAKVYECYLGNPKQTLNCSAEVRAFSTCVERARQVSWTHVWCLCVCVFVRAQVCVSVCLCPCVF